MKIIIWRGQNCKKLTGKKQKKTSLTNPLRRISSSRVSVCLRNTTQRYYMVNNFWLDWCHSRHVCSQEAKTKTKIYLKNTTVYITIVVFIKFNSRPICPNTIIRLFIATHVSVTQYIQLPQHGLLKLFGRMCQIWCEDNRSVLDLI